jgi:Uma2 family endonuclease
MVLLAIQQIRVLPGQRVQLEGVSWSLFEEILAELGEDRATRIAYRDGILEIMAPLPEHETAKVFLGDFVKILLDKSERDWISLGSTTFKQQLMAAGIEPDDCFYIQNCDRILGKTRLDLTIDPPPDLAIEVDLTSKTQLSAYVALAVPEVWCFENGELQINVLEEGKYGRRDRSPLFPDLPLRQVIPQFMQRGQTEVMSVVERSFRRWVQQQFG